MFQGYTQESVDFMWGIRFNNERPWFLEHKDIYTDHFLTPTRELAAQVFDALHQQLDDAPHQCKVSRIYRDARRLFGRGPYKDNLWFCIRDGDTDWTGLPTFWFEIAPEYYSYGLGFWSAKPLLMDTYRKHIDRDPQELLKLVRALNKDGRFQLEGPEYARAKKAPLEELQSWYNKKSLMLTYEVRPLDERIFDPALADDLISGYKSLMPFYRFFTRIVSEMPTQV